jgi:hypothetical protein
MDERRKATRKKVMAFTPVYQPETGSILGYLGDLTLQGALVIGEKTLELGRQLTVGIEFPKPLPGVEGLQMSLQAQVTHCVRETDSTDYLIGFEFLQTTAEQVNIIALLLERYNYRYQ